ncbi:MAG: helix-turn-helix domain-containing protein [Gammaproteobacteria bacterium]
MKKLPRTTAKRSPCPIATTLDVVGDKWTLLLVRDMGIFGRHRNKEFQQGKEGIPSNILADRLKSMLAHGLIRKEQYQAHPPRYEYHLTEAGQDLLPIARAMAQWGADHVAGIRIPKH